MENLFSGLEDFGLDNLSKMNIYSDDEKDDKKKANSKKEKPKFNEADFIFEKTYHCPVCDEEFKAKTVKTGKVKLESADTDLRPKYHLLDSLKYDAIVCPKCGYSALNRFFNYMTSTQAKLIKEQISNNFKGTPDEGEILTYDEAIARHKLALVNTIVKKGKISERAYTCLKLAWLIRGKTETLPADTPDYEQVKKELAGEELEFLSKAYEGFMSAFEKELFPMCGMDEITITYLIADLARRCGRYEEASRWVSRVLISREANERIKAKARDIKELIQNEKN